MRTASAPISQGVTHSTTQDQHVFSIGALTTLSVAYLKQNHVTAGQEGIGKHVGEGEVMR